MLFFFAGSGNKRIQAQIQRAAIAGRPLPDCAGEAV